MSADVASMVRRKTQRPAIAPPVMQIQLWMKDAEMEQAVVQELLIELALQIQSGGSVLESPHQTVARTGHTLCTAKAAGQRGSSLLIFSQPDIFLILRRVGTFRVEGWGRICRGVSRHRRRSKAAPTPFGRNCSPRA